MKNAAQSPQAICYLDQEFAFKDGKHDVENLILLGWLLCKHWDEESQGTELWHIINPELHETVPREKVLALWEKIIYVAVDLNFKLINSKKDSMDKTNSIAYHR